MSIIAECPRCNGFVSMSMAKAYNDAPDIFDDEFHDTHTHDYESLDDLIEGYNYRDAIIYEMWHQVVCLNSGMDKDIILSNLEKLVMQAMMKRET